MTVAKYPVEVSDEEGQVDAINYLLSGPAGLGQNFAGFSSFLEAYLRPTFRQPFVTPLTKAPIPVYSSYPLSNAVACDSTGTPVAPNALTRYVQFTFTTPFTQAPYQFGDTVTVSNLVDGGLPSGVNNAFSLAGTRVATVTTDSYQMYPATVTGTGLGAYVGVDLLPDPGGAYTTVNTEVSVFSLYPGYGYNIGDTLLITGDLLGGTTPANDLTLTVTATDSGFFNDRYTVFSSTTTDLIVQTNQEYNWPNYVSGGDLGRNWMNRLLSTDCNGRVTVSGPTDRVFASGQCDISFDYDMTMASEFDVVFTIDRGTGFLDRSPGSTDFLFDFFVPITRQIYHFSDTGPNTVSELSTVFTSVIDGPNLPFGYYWYILDIQFVTRPTYRKPYAIGEVYDAIASGTSVNQVATYTGISPVNIIGSGVGLVVDLEIDTTVTTNYTDCTTITVTTPGTGYQVGDTFSVSGTLLGGASPANDMLLTVSQIQYPGDATVGVVTLETRSLSVQVVKE